MPYTPKTPSATETEGGGTRGRTAVDEAATAALLAVAERQYHAASALLSDEFAQDRDACFHLARGWQALGQALGAAEHDAGPAAQGLAAEHDAGPAAQGQALGAAEHDAGPAAQGLAARLEAQLWPDAADEQRRQRRAALDAVLAIAERYAVDDFDAEPACPPSRELHRLCELLIIHVQRFHSRRRGAQGRPGVIQRWLPFSLGAAAFAAALILALSPRPAGSPFATGADGKPTRNWRGASVEALSAPGAWVGRYYRNIRIDGPAERRTVDAISFKWAGGPPFDGFLADLFSARWDTCLTIPRQTKVLFELGSDDGSRLIVDGKRLIDEWHPNSMGFARKSTVLEGGLHHLRVEYYEDTDHAGVELRAVFRGPPGRLSAPVDVDGPEPCRPRAPASQPDEASGG